MNTTSKEKVKKGSWSSEEDQILINYIRIHGDGKWPTLPQRAGLNRGGKSCRLRWRNYLRPGIVRGNISKDEEDLIIKLQSLVGNRWSLIAEMLPGRTDNEIKNYWNTSLAKELGHTKQPSASTKKISSKTPKKKQVKYDQTSENNLPSNTSQSEESYSYQMVHDNGQSSNDHMMNTNLTAGSSTMEQQEDDDLLGFLMDQYDLGNLNSVFDQELMTDHHVMMNPRNDHVPVVVEEDEALKLQNVAEPLLMNTDGNGDQIQIEDEVNMMMMKKNCEVATMEDTYTLNNLKELTSFLDVEYEWKNDIWYQMVTKINQL